MEAVASIYSEKVKPLAEVAKEYLETKNKTIQELADELNFSRSAISKYLSGKYDSKSTAIEKRLEQYLREKGVEVNLRLASKLLTKRNDFFEYQDSANVIGVCNSCQEFSGLGIVVGKSGYGKTYTLKHYAKLPRVAYVECDDTMSSRDLVEAIERALGIPSTYGTIWKRVNGIREFFNVNRGYLLIVDEADKLISKYTQKKMEILRAIFDQSDVGLVIAGEPKLEAQIKGYLARFANRVDFYTSLRGLTKADVEQYLEGYKIEPDAMAELVSRACNPQTGCFRLLDRTMNNVIRLLNESGQDTITLKVIGQASSMMML